VSIFDLRYTCYKHTRFSLEKRYKFNIAIYCQTYLEYSIVVFKLSTNCEPPTIAASQAPLMIYLYAQSNAYAELEHAVSTVNDGPHKPSAYERRFER